MKYYLVFILLFPAIPGMSQKTVDTTVMYNSIMTKKRTEFFSTGEISKETYYYNSGKIQIEYYYYKGEQTHWISYDREGKITAEWDDHSIENDQFIRLRNLTFLFSWLCIAGLVTILCKINYRNTFYVIFLFSVIYPFVIMSLERKIFADKNQIGSLVFLSVLIISPIILFSLSMLNFFKKKPIPILISVLALLISVGFLFFFWMVAHISGAGILG